MVKKTAHCKISWFCGLQQQKLLSQVTQKKKTESEISQTALVCVWNLEHLKSFHKKTPKPEKSRPEHLFKNERKHVGNSSTKPQKATVQNKNHQAHCVENK